MNAAERYIEDVMKKRVVTGKYLRLVVKGHTEDLKAQRRKDYPYWFDQDAAQHPLTVFTHFKFSKGVWGGSPFDLLPWQAFVLWLAYGWKFKGSNRRRYNKVYIKVARKNGKTEFLAGIGLYGHYFDNSDKDVEVYWFATKKAQAQIGFERQKEMTRLLMSDSPAFAAMAGLSKHRVYSTSDLSFTAYLGKDSKTEDGSMPFYGICDEYHAHPNDDMVGVMESGMVSRQNPMLWIITTAGFNPLCPAARLEKNLKKGLEGVAKNDQVLGIIFDLDEGDDYEDPKNWGKANPGLGVSVSLDNLLDAHKNAKSEGVTKLNNFLTKNLNKWLKQSKTWISDTDFMRGSSPLDTEILKGRVCFGGLDLASTSDLCALVLLFPPCDEFDTFVTLCWFWCPEDNAIRRARTDAVPYMEWHAEQYLDLTEGNVMDDRYIFHKILQLASRYDIHSIGYDPYAAAILAKDLSEEGLQMEPFRQGFLSMSEPTKTTEKMLMRGEINHLGNPVLRWMASNVAIKTDPAGNIKMDKSKSADKIDGMVSLVMSIGQYMTHKDENIYGQSPVLIIKA